MRIDTLFVRGKLGKELAVLFGGDRVPGYLAEPVQVLRAVVGTQVSAMAPQSSVLHETVLEEHLLAAMNVGRGKHHSAGSIGATHSYFGRDDWAPFAPGLKTIEDATEIRRRVLLAFELAGAIADIAKLYMRHDFRHIDPAKARVLLLEGSPRVLGAYPEDLSAKAEAVLGRLGVEVRTHTQVIGIGPGRVEAAGKRIGAVVTLWSAGVVASPLGRLLGAPLDRRGAVLVDDQLNPPGMPNIFVLGDLAHLEQDGRQVPGVAQPAIQMGDHLANMLAADLACRPRPVFRYFDKGDIATIGRMNAVARVAWPFKTHCSGFQAWVTWLTVHIFFLICFRNRLSVLAAWIWTYFTFTRGARLIAGDQRLPGWPDRVDSGSEDAAENLTCKSAGEETKHS